MTLVDTFAFALTAAMTLVSSRYTRGLVWIAAVMADYFVSTNYWRTGFGEPILFAGLCDAAVCLLLFLIATRMWELWLWVIMLTSMIVNFTFMALTFGGAAEGLHEVYAIALEILTATALFLIGGTASWERSGRTDVAAFRSWLTVLGVRRPTWFQVL